MIRHFRKISFKIGKINPILMDKMNLIHMGEKGEKEERKERIRCRGIYSGKMKERKNERGSECLFVLPSIRRTLFYCFVEFYTINIH